MSYEAERVRLVAHFKAGWDASIYAGIPVFYENQPLKQPTTDFVTYRIADSEGKQAEVAGAGPTLHRYVGLIQIDILAVVGSGSSTARKMGDLICDMHRRKQMVDSAGGVITFRTPSVKALGTINERYRVVVICPYQKDIRH